MSMFQVHSVKTEVGGKTLEIETGKLARQADGSVLVKYGDTRVLVTAVSAKEARPDINFFPLTVEFQERYYASGKIPGGFLKREGRPSLNATLSARMIDRPLRPLFPEGYRNDTQVAITVLSFDTEADVDVAAAAGASAALSISDIPFNGPTAACRVGRIDGEWIICPSWEKLEANESDLEILVAGTKNGITMVEGGAKQVPEEEVLEAVLRGHEVVKTICDAVSELQAKCGRPKREFIPHAVDTSLMDQVREYGKAGLLEALSIREKLQRYDRVKAAKADVLARLVTEDLKSSNPDEAKKLEKDATEAFELLHYNLMREMVLDKGARIDGRDTKTIRPIEVEVGLLPRAHGTSLFTRGETQVLAAVALGTSDDEQMIDTIYSNGSKKFMLHYNFPPFSVGETGRFGGQSRRELGHGALAERSIGAMIPSKEEFPYTIRIVCETLESNGSSSMGSVCSSSMALMDAGVPIAKPVAGIAMGLIKEGDRVAILSDILGDEDHLGDMDFKVAGTKDGVTGIQMDIKIDSVTKEIMEQALRQAHEGRLHILGKMENAITEARTDLSPRAPRITSFKVPVEKIGMVIGPSGKMIKEIVAQTGVKIDIEDDGSVRIFSSEGEASKKAEDWIRSIVAEVEVGQVYTGTVKRIVDFGAFIEVLPNQDGLLHVSEIAWERVNRVDEYMKEGDKVEVKVIDIDPSGKIRLSRKALLPNPNPDAPVEEYRPRSHKDRNGGGRGEGRGGDRGGRGGRDRDRGDRRHRD